MKTPITLIFGAGALFLAVLCAVPNFESDRHSEDRHISLVAPVATRSKNNEERRSVSRRRERVRNLESEFARHVSRIEPNTAFDDPSDGYFAAYLLTRSAEDLLKQGEESDNQQAILELFEKSYASFLGVHEVAPEWKNGMVLRRLEMTKNSLKEAYFASNTGN